MQNSTTEIQMHCQQRFAVVARQIQANTLAQLGSNPLKPHLRATAHPNTPSEGSENGSILERKTITFYFAVLRYKEQGHGDRAFSGQEPWVLPLPSLPFNPICMTWIMVSKCIISYSGISSPDAF